MNVLKWASTTINKFFKSTQTLLPPAPNILLNTIFRRNCGAKTGIILFSYLLLLPWSIVFKHHIWRWRVERISDIDAWRFRPDDFFAVDDSNRRGWWQCTEYPCNADKLKTQVHLLNFKSPRLGIKHMEEITEKNMFGTLWWCGKKR